MAPIMTKFIFICARAKVDQDKKTGGFYSKLIIGQCNMCSAQFSHAI